MAKITITKKISKVRKGSSTGVIYIPAELMEVFDLDGRMCVITIEPVEEYFKRKEKGDE